MDEVSDEERMVPKTEENKLKNLQSCKTIHTQVDKG